MICYCHPVACKSLTLIISIYNFSGINFITNFKLISFTNGYLSFMLNAVGASLIFEFVKLCGPTLCYSTVLKLCHNLIPVWWH